MAMASLFGEFGIHMPNRLLLVHALSSVHVGTGSGIGYIDLPLARETVTNWPYIPGSAVKGVLSDHFGAGEPAQRRAQPMLRAAFGVADDAQATGSNAGALVFSDLNLLLLPIRSIYGTFAWATCPLALSRFSRDLEACNRVVPPLTFSQSRAARPQTPRSALLPGAPANAATIYLADADIETEASTVALTWATTIADLLFSPASPWRALFLERFIVLPDNMFSFFAEKGTEVATRVRINPETGTVDRGALWTEESLPPESVLSGVTWCDRVYHDAKTITAVQLLDQYCQGERSIQIGGKATVGKGRVRAVFA
jgi:CRISPR-associated protein Cmr4